MIPPKCYEKYRINRMCLGKPIKATNNIEEKCMLCKYYVHKLKNGRKVREDEIIPKGRHALTTSRQSKKVV